ncbi:hypothetical protein EVAR_98504_1, partial [Eumeta japonica]
VYDRDTDEIDRGEIYKMLTHAGLVPRRRTLSASKSKKIKHESNDHLPLLDSPELFHYDPNPSCPRFQSISLPIPMVLADTCDDTLVRVCRAHLVSRVGGLQQPISFVDSSYIDWDTDFPSVEFAKISPKLYDASDALI